MKKTLNINEAYAVRYSTEHYGHKYELLDWLKSYCRRNNIPVSDTESKLCLTFKSQNQMDWFVRKGNQCFPYFEFL